MWYAGTHSNMFILSKEAEMVKDSGGAQMLVNSTRKQLKQLESNLDANIKHCKLIGSMVKGPELHLDGAQGIAKDMLKTAAATQKQVDKMYDGIRTVTAKMPREQRQSSRKEIEALLAKVDKKAMMLGKTALGMAKLVNDKRKNTPTAAMPGNEFILLLRCLQAVMVLVEGWKKKKKKEVG
jgi:polyhydroxyalkanoate synthesis regulator phasin